MLTAFAIWLHVAAMSPSRIAPDVAPGFFADALGAVAELDGTADELAIVAVMGVCEGAGRRDIIGDNGAAIGAWQLHPEHLRGHAREDVLADRRLQARLWLRSYRDAVEACGSPMSALGRIAAGVCGGAPKLAKRRLAGRC